MADRSLALRLRRLQVEARRLATGALAGAYRGRFRGSGIEFASVRPYVPGDDVRSIDWNVTARSGMPYVKEFVEERERVALLLVDGSNSMHFGSGQNKAETLLEAAALLGFAAEVGGDRVGLLLHSDRLEAYHPPRRGLPHLLSILQCLATHRCRSPRTDLSHGLQLAARLVPRGSVVFLLSDFHDGGFDGAVALSTRRHDLVPVIVRDRRERDLPRCGIVALTDLETGEEVWVDTSRRGSRDALFRVASIHLQRARDTFRRVGIDWFELQTHQPVSSPIFDYFRRRRDGRRAR